jgi:CshA-type fibril repeat protein
MNGSSFPLYRLKRRLVAVDAGFELFGGCRIERRQRHGVLSAYSFSNINPADYTVTVAGKSVQAAVVATELTTADVNVPVDSPVAAPVSGGTLQNSPATVAIDATVDPTTTVDLDSVELWDPDTETWGNEVVVSGEGTWRVTSGGDLKFTPIAGFTGDSSEVTYRFHDAYGTPATVRLRW